MVKLITGKQGTGKSTVLCNMIKDELENSDKEIILIVPEQESLTWTSKMSSLLPPSANRRFTATTFTFLPNIIFRLYGGLAANVVDEGTRSLIVWRAMLSVREQLKIYKAGDNGREERAVPYLMNAIDEFRQSGITPAEAERALNALEEEVLSGDDDRASHSDLVARLSDAVNVYGTYNSILHESFVDRGDVLDNLANTLSEHPFFSGKSVYLDSFYSLSAHEQRILKLIIEQADDVTVTCACPKDKKEREDSIVFDDVEAFMEKTLSYAAEAHKQVEYTDLREDLRHAGKNEFLDIDRDLFSSEPKEIPKEIKEKGGPSVPSEYVKIIKCGDRFDEAEACASIICRLIRNGYKYSDIAVIARSITSREGILDNTLRRHGIKCFISESTEVSSSPAVKLVLAALGVAAGGWKRRDVIRLYKTGMTPCGRGTAPGFDSLEGDVFENYTYTWNIRGKKMYTSGDWTMNPDGYTDRNPPENAEILRLANSAKNKIIPPLEKLLSVFGDGNGVATVREISERIYYFAEDYSVDEILTEMAENYCALGMARDADRTSRSWSYVTEILDKMVSVLGDTPLNVVRFARLFASVASGMDKGTIPTGVDEVILGSSSNVRLDHVKCAILVGSVAEEFPANVDDSSHFFDDSDKVALEGVGITLSSPTEKLALSREYFMYYRSVLCATDRLYILAPTGNGAELSDPAKRIETILGEKDIKCTETFSKMPLGDVLFDRVTAEYLISRRTDPDDISTLRSILGDAKKNVSLTAKDDMIQPDGKKTSMSLSQSVIDTFIKCPFSYYCNSVIKLKPSEKADIGLNNVGSFIHAVFERFFTAVPAEKIRDGIGSEELRATAQDIIDGYISDLADAAGSVKGERDGRLDYLMERLSKYLFIFLEEMTKELAQSKFVPVALELPIGTTVPGKESATPLEFTTAGGVRVSLHGIADRVDVYDAPDGKKYMRIIDYKTGSKDFKFDLLSKGFDIQMLIYLFSLWKFGIPGEDTALYEPAGTVYIKASPSNAKISTISDEAASRESVASSLTRSGIVLNEEDVIRAMDADISGQFAPVIVKDDKLVPRDTHTFLVTSERFGELEKELQETVTRIASSILEGHAEARPVKLQGDPCSYCRYSSVCKSKNFSKE